MKKLSIILPVYNVEKYLHQCIESIVNQIGFEECELLIIDDGSKDGSSKICDRYIGKNAQIKVYHKKNGGLSDARNYGLSRAKGDYVLFIDSDDFLIEGALKTILEKLLLNSIDLLLMDAILIEENGEKYNGEEFEYKHYGLSPGIIYTGKQAIKKQLRSGIFQTTVWLGIYRRQFLVENQLWFTKGLLHEDELWTPMVFVEAKRVMYEPYDYYAYRLRTDSITRNKRKDKSANIDSLIYIYSYMFKWYEWKIKDIPLLLALKDDISRRYLHAIVQWNFYKYPNLMRKVDRLEILKNAKLPKNYIRAVLLILNVRLYFQISLYYQSKFKNRG